MLAVVEEVDQTALLLVVLVDLEAAEQALKELQW
jgi:hypothetical protein